MGDGLFDRLIPNIDDIFGLRDKLGVALKKCSIVTRTWVGKEPGDGEAQDQTVQILPSPKVVQYSQEMGIVEGGAVQAGDIILKSISKNSYPKITDVDCTTSDPSIEKFYDVGGILFRVISVKERHLSWQVQIRRLSSQKRWES